MEAMAEKERIVEIMNLTALNIALKNRDLPGCCYVVSTDPETGKRYGAYLDISVEEDIARINRTYEFEMLDNKTPGRIADELLDYPIPSPLLCDEITALQIESDAESFTDGMNKGHYKLVRRKSGVLEIYTPYPAEVTVDPATNRRNIKFEK